MAIKVKCSCGKILSVEARYEGKHVTCPECGNDLRIISDPTIPLDPGLKNTVRIDQTGKNKYSEQSFQETVIENEVKSAEKPVESKISRETQILDSSRLKKTIDVSEIVTESIQQPYGEEERNIKSDEVSTTQEQEPVQAITCPKCGVNQHFSEECIKCGVIFSKISMGKTLVSGTRDEQENPQSGISSEIKKTIPVYSPVKKGNKFKTSKRLDLVLFFLVVLMVVGFITGQFFYGNVNKTSNKSENPPLTILNENQVTDNTVHQAPIDREIEKGNVAYFARKYQNAVQSYSKITGEISDPELKERISKSYYYVGKEDYKKKNFGVAIKNFITALEYNDQFWDIHTDLAIAYTKIDDYILANNHYEKVVQYKPDNIAARYNLGSNLFILEDYKNAIVHLEHAIKLYPGDQHLLDKLGLCYYRQKETGKTSEILGRLLCLMGKNAEDRAVRIKNQDPLKNRDEILRDLTFVMGKKRADGGECYKRYKNIHWSKIFDYYLKNDYKDTFNCDFREKTPEQAQTLLKKNLGIYSMLLAEILVDTEYQNIPPSWDTNIDTKRSKLYSSYQCEHFTVNYDRDKLSLQIDFGEYIHRYLRDAYRIVGQEFDFFPDENIVVRVIKSDSRAFFRISDRSISIPIGSLYTSFFSQNISEKSKMFRLKSILNTWQGRQVCPEFQKDDSYFIEGFKDEFKRFLLEEHLKKIVIHEYTHYIIFKLSGNTANVPRWMHEGLAQYTAKEYEFLFSFQIKHWLLKYGFIPVASINGYIHSGDTERIIRGYTESLVIVHYLMDKYNINDFKSLFKKLVHNKNSGKCFEEIFYMDYEDLVNRAMRHAEDIANTPEDTSNKGNCFTALFF